MAAKKGDVARVSACAAKRRSVGPTANVMMGDVRLLSRSACCLGANGDCTYLADEGLVAFFGFSTRLEAAAA